MKYSIVIPYRDRKEHLELLLPKLLEIFEGKEYEIIISEQDDKENFKLANVENVGFDYSTGDAIVFHQVDYLPADDVSYDIDDKPVLPHAKGIFLNDKLELRDYTDIPAGYRKWSEEIDPDFYGGIIIMKREHFEKINGFNPMYVGWGNEDEDVRERFKWANIPVQRNKTGTFYVLNHTDNCPSPTDGDRYIDFMKGREIYAKAFEYKHIGYKNLKYDVEVFDMEGYDNVKWVKSKNYRIEGI